jgi:SagB-type dehydrogenase family enzyme
VSDPAHGAELASVRVGARIYGDDAVPLDDPAEQYHEASKLYPTFAARSTRGGILARDPALQASSARSVRRSPHLPAVALPRPDLPTTAFADVIEARRSEREFGEEAVSLPQLAGLLHAGYGLTHQLLSELPAGVGPQLRSVPSGGGLFPLELYVVPWRVVDLGTGLYHLDPLRWVLERLRGGGLLEEVAAAAIYPEPMTRCAALVVATAVFWRTRFKYGQRGYRFALLEAGHVVQNIVLAAAAYRLASVPLGGFYDARLDAVLGVDGVEESAVYAVGVGPRESRGD